MVLQQQSKVTIWGWSDKDSRIVIKTSWTREKTVTRSDAEGKWEVKIQTPTAGGPYSIIISDGESLKLENVLIGEVWFCSGQSNMEMPVKGFYGQPVEGGGDAIFSANKEQPIRMCTVKRKVSSRPLEDCDAAWLENSPQAVANTSAVAYFFARDLQKILGTPIGIIVADWGGTGIEPWMDRETISSEFKEYDLSHLDSAELPQLSQYKPCTLFNGMVNPLIPYTIKGWIWYQGESNRGMADRYIFLQKSYADMMRRLWGQPEMPFYFVQIAPFAFRGSPEGDTAARLMEAQAKTLKLIHHSGMATTADIGEPWCIHPRKKQEVSRRLALMALRNDYGISIPGAIAPSYDHMIIKDGEITLYFANNDSGLGPVNSDIIGFEVAGEDRVFHPATARVQKGYATIKITCPEVPYPVAVRYAFHNYAPGTVYNGAGIPLAPFRTDDWPE